MPLYPVLDLEEVIQENDKTRLDASKSFASGGATFTTLSIKPSLSDSYVDVTTDTYLDWQFTFTFDIVAGVNNKLDFNENGAVLVATLTAGNYTPAALASHIQTQMRAASAVDYVVTVDDDNAFTIVGTVSFTLLAITGTNANTSILPAIGFAEDSAANTTLTGDDVETIEKTVTAKYHLDPSTDVTSTKTVLVISETADRLFSSDDKLRAREAAIMSYVPVGRSTWKHVHREAQKLILQWLDTQGFWKILDAKYVAKDIEDLTEVRDWAIVLTLKLIFENLRNAKDDVFEAKMKKYDAEILPLRSRAILRIDTNDDGQVDIEEGEEIRIARVRRV